MVEDEELSGGDFVRTIKQLIDLLRQLALLAPVDRTPRAAAREAADALFRGVVAASTAIDVDRAEGIDNGNDRERPRPVVTVRRGEDWGRRAARPADVVEVADDAAGAALVDAAGGKVDRPPCSGCSAATSAAPSAAARPSITLADEVGEYPVDLGLVVLDGVERAFLAHLVARRSWWRGEVVAAMNAEYLGAWDVAPRGHPNDGRLDVLHVVDLGVGDRWKAWRRLPTGTHVPHPGIALRPAAAVDPRSADRSRCGSTAAGPAPPTTWSSGSNPTP